MTEPAIANLLRPLSARSLVASALLGTHPPALPGRLLVAMGERFGISDGTTRVALSRMVERGELSNDDGVYALAGPLLERQERQDRSRRTEPTQRLDGTWQQAVVTATGRSPSDRHQLRRNLASLGLGELREGVWMRPANLDPARLPVARSAVAEQVAWFTVTPATDQQPADLIVQLFDLDAWAETANALQFAIGQARAELDTRDDAVVSGFNLASATLRHVVHDPQLPAELAPPSWPAEALRHSYEQLERAYQKLLRNFFRSIAG